MKLDKNVTVLDQAFVLHINASSLEFFKMKSWQRSSQVRNLNAEVILISEWVKNSEIRITSTPRCFANQVAASFNFRKPLAIVTGTLASSILK